MKFGFLIDHRKCIGCHACSVACKEEHQVPLGVYRTWVKYVEKGAFPHTQRHFTVMLLGLMPGTPLVASFLASCTALVGLLVFEHLWLMAGQAAPLS